MKTAFHAGVSGLMAYQQMMDTIGNNIANVNTTGYKTSRVTFQDIFSQTAAGGTANLGFIGGTNPMQIGLGIKLATVDVLHTPAPIARTDNPFDMMIEGDGYFIVQNENGDPFYTRAGNFYLDDLGYLVTSHGYYVMGYVGEFTFVPGVEGTEDDPGPPFVPGDDPIMASLIPGEIDYSQLSRIQLRVDNPDYYPDEIDDPYEPGYNGAAFIDLLGFSVGQDGSVSVILNNIKTTIATLGIGMFPNPGGLEKAGNSLYREGPASGQVVETTALQNGAGKVNGGGLEMSNVDLATEFTDMIVTQRGFQANSRIITVSDTMLEELVNLKR